MVAVERISQVVLSIEEREAILRADGKTDEQIDSELNQLRQAANEAQARYDKAPPAFFRPVPPE